jgi:hypothetical protein
MSTPHEWLAPGFTAVGAVVLLVTLVRKIRREPGGDVRTLSFFTGVGLLAVDAIAAYLFLKVQGRFGVPLGIVLIAIAYTGLQLIGDKLTAPRPTPKNPDAEIEAFVALLFALGSIAWLLNAFDVLHH